LEHMTTTAVRYADTDQMGYVHHAKYFEYFEMGRTEYMRARGRSYAQVEKSGHFLVIVESGATYVKPARYDMEIGIKTRIRDMSHAQVTFEYSVFNDGELLCEGWTRLACTNRSGKPCRLPQDLKEILKGEAK